MDAFAPHSLYEALELRAAHPEAIPVAGGTDLMVDVNFGRAHPAALLDLSRVPELGQLRRSNGAVFIGSGVTFASLEESGLPALAQAAHTVGSRQIRNRATLGGNVATASPAGDSLPVIAAWDGHIVLASVERGARSQPWREFLTGPKETSLAPDELITGVQLTAPRGPGSFSKVGPRAAMVIAVVGVCVQLDEVARSVHVALGSAGPTVLRATEAEAYGATVVPWDDPEGPVAHETLLEFGRLAAAAARPIDDLRGTDAYRRHAVEVLARRALEHSITERKAP
jgi:CO/xanthine dehydrogenase FAD-binding subunit